MFGDIAGTGSMRPAMHGGHTTIETTCFSNNDLQLGDIIVYDDLEGRNVIHQIIEIRPEGVITKGINNEVADPGMILWDDIISLVIAIIY
jgi:signal peptidase I